MTKFIHLIIFSRPQRPILLIVLIFLNCQSSNHHSEITTFRVARGTYTNHLVVNGELKAKKSTTIRCPDIWPAPKIKKLVPEGTFVRTGEIVCELDASEVRSRHGNALTELENARAAFHQSRAELELQRVLLTSQVQSIEASTQIANLNLSRLNYVSPINKKIIQLEIQRAEVEKKKLLDKLASLELIQTSELKKMEMKIKQAENKLNRAQMFLDRLTLRAPQDGILVYQTNWATGEKIGEGETVWGRMPLMQIPEISLFQVEIAASEANIKKIKKDQAVKIEVDARPGIKLTGTVARVAKMGKPIKKDSKIKTFEVMVDVDSTDFELQPGLTTTCEIILESVPDTLLVPNICLFQEDSTQYIYCQDGHLFRKTPVEVGKQGENFSIITGGLAGGEVVSLIRPAAGKVKQ